MIKGKKFAPLRKYPKIVGPSDKTRGENDQKTGTLLRHRIYPKRKREPQFTARGEKRESSK